MKVNIGAFKNYIGPYQIAEKILFWKDKENDDSVHDFGTWLAGGKGRDSLLMKACEWVESKRKRKVQIHIDNYDTWNMDTTLAMIILPMLKQLKATKHGSPMCSDYFDQTSNSAQYSFDFYALGDDDAWKAGHDEWEKIMDEMIWTFEQLQPECDWEAQYTIQACELDMDDYPEDEGKLTTPVRWKKEGKYDFEGMKKHQDRITAGLVLFGTWYLGLWD